MTDKEVGELWTKHKLPVVEQLIRKLVEERANSKCEDSYPCNKSHTPFCYRRTFHLREALYDFGIDPETWT